MDQEVLGKLLLLIYDYKGRIFGALLGLISSLLFIYFGFILTIFIMIFVVGGYLIGHKYDNQGASIRDIISDILPPSR